MKDRLAASRSTDGTGSTGRTERSGSRRTESSAVRSAPADAPIATIEHALAELARLFASPRVHERRASGSGVQISRTGLRCLTLVDRLGPVSVTKLAVVMDLSQATASRAISSLESAGLLARSADPGDGRVTYCTTTAAGRRALQRIQRFMYGQLSGALEGMTDDRQRVLASTLTELVERLQSAPLRSTSLDSAHRADPAASSAAASSAAASSPAASARDVSGREESTS
jgi:DNA-binding MarR family transcriptional regulator